LLPQAFSSTAAEVAGVYAEPEIHLPPRPAIGRAPMQNEIAELPATVRVHALRANGFLFQLGDQAGFNIGR
jgi:hypothetical protein